MQQKPLEAYANIGSHRLEALLHEQFPERAAEDAD
jgi:hypothetical protein